MATDLKVAPYAPVDPDTFRFAMDVIGKVGAGLMPAKRAPSESSFSVETPSGEPIGVSLADSPLMRGLVAMNVELQHLPDDERSSIFQRALEFGGFCKENADRLRRMKLMRGRSKLGVELSVAVFHAAAVCPFEIYMKKGEEYVRFNAERFFSIALKVRAEMCAAMDDA